MDGGALSRTLQRLWLLPSGPDQVHTFRSVRPPSIRTPLESRLRLPPTGRRYPHPAYISPPVASRTSLGGSKWGGVAFLLEAQP